jgi:hypothetical protein
LIERVKGIWPTWSWAGRPVLIVFVGPLSPYWCIQKASFYNFTWSNPAFFDRKHKSGSYSLNSFNQFILLILVFELDYDLTLINFVYEKVLLWQRNESMAIFFFRPQILVPFMIFQLHCTSGDQTLLSLIENIKVGHIPLTLSINSFYFNQSILILIKVQNWYLPLRQHLSMSCYPNGFVYFRG